jgi:imidazoleglycerol-phosphate dehydratase / histidinol-phosphatase
LITSSIKQEELHQAELKDNCSFIADNWDQIFEFLKQYDRSAFVERTTSETTIRVRLSLDGSGRSNISTGLGFLDHMLDQLSKHSDCDLTVEASGDIHVDEHHLIEDVALSIGEAFTKALGNKTGIGRFGFTVPMDDSIASVAVDFGGRNWLEWDVNFKREKIGDVPTEMFRHFFKSFTDSAHCNLHISAKGENEHHKIEAIFKAWARAIKMAISQNSDHMQIPSTKGSI